MFGEIKFLFSRILKQLSPVFYVKQKYYRIFGTSLDLVNPQGFNEKNMLACLVLAKAYSS
ncbi:hypothetical protein NXX37_02795 [Parabacteroides distasonis]|nr:hypothetical protein NXX37_02795 [Parabacteroides distasonis]